MVPAWVAEMDFAQAEPITEALVAAVRRGALGYPPHSDGAGRGVRRVRPAALGLGGAGRGVGRDRRGGGRHPPGARGALPAGTGRRADAVLPAVPRRRRGHRPRRSCRSSSTPTPTTRASTWPRCRGRSPAVPAPCCSATRTTRSATCPGASELAALAALAREYDARVVSDEIHGPLVLPGATLHAVPLRGRARHRGHQRLEGVQHAGDARRAARGPRPGRPGAPRRRAGPGAEHLVEPRRHRERGRVARLRRLAGRPGGAPRRPAGAAGASCSTTRLPRRADAPAGGDVPRLARPAGVRRRRPGRGGARPRRTTGAGPGLPARAGRARALNLATSPERLERIVDGLATALA